MFGASHAIQNVPEAQLLENCVDSTKVGFNSQETKCIP